MAHLAGLSFVHRDLAARNVLLDHDMILKVADFGLSRGAKKTSASATGNGNDGAETYYRSTNGVFPLRWTSPEAMTSLKFTTASDIWSFGIVLVEVMQNGALPYKQMKNKDVIIEVQKGFRVEKASLPGCSDELYATLMHCWSPEPKQRPTFNELVETFARMIEHDPHNGKIPVHGGGSGGSSSSGTGGGGGSRPNHQTPITSAYVGAGAGAGADEGDGGSTGSGGGGRYYNADDVTQAAAESAESESALFRESGEDGVVLNPLRQETVRQIHVTQPLQAPNSNSNSAESRSTASVTATPDLVNGAVNLHAGRSTFEERGGYMRPRNLTPSTAVEGSSRQ